MWPLCVLLPSVYWSVHASSAALPDAVCGKCRTYRGYPACEGADDLRHAASRSVQHALGAGLKQQHAGQVEDQSWILCLLQLLGQSLTVQEQGLSAWHTITEPKITDRTRQTTVSGAPIMILKGELISNLIKKNEKEND